MLSCSCCSCLQHDLPYQSLSLQLGSEPGTSSHQPRIQSFGSGSHLMMQSSTGLSTSGGGSDAHNSCPQVMDESIMMQHQLYHQHQSQAMQGISHSAVMDLHQQCQQLQQQQQAAQPQQQQHGQPQQHHMDCTPSLQRSEDGQVQAKQGLGLNIVIQQSSGGGGNGKQSGIGAAQQHPVVIEVLQMEDVDRTAPMDVES